MVEFETAEGETGGVCGGILITWQLLGLILITTRSNITTDGRGVEHLKIHFYVRHRAKNQSSRIS